MKTLKIKNKGFTLIELLVVISIIGMLSSVVLGSLSSARQKAANTKVVAEVNQLKTAFELYRNDKGKYPNDGVSDQKCVGWWCSDIISYLTAELVANKYISAISNPASPNDNFYYITGGEWYLYYDDPFDPYFMTCGGVELKHYALYFYYDKATLNLPEIGYYYGGYYNWNGDFPDIKTNWYCIGL